MNALACGNCGAGLPPPDVSGASACIYCGAEHRSDRTSEILAVALAQTGDNRSDVAPCDSGFIEAIAEGTLGSLMPEASPSRGHAGDDAARIPMNEEAVRRLLRQQFAESESVYVCPHVPPKKELVARQAHAGILPERERILALYDATWFGGGEEGFVVTVRRLCWKNANEPAASIEWRDIEPDQLYGHGRRLFIGNDVLMIHDEDILDACVDTFHVLAHSAMPPRPIASDVFARSGERPSRAALPPPPPNPEAALPYAAAEPSHAPDHACYKCRTPLSEAAEQCAYCGAKPTKKKSWFRTA